MSFTKGTRALGRCARCGDKVPYLSLLDDGYIKGLRVCGSCYDIAHPAEKPVRADEPIALQKPAPDIDDDSPGGGDSLVVSMGWDTYFGGGT